MAYIVVVKGSPSKKTGGGEICVVDEEYTHGIESFGWYDTKLKLCIVDVGHWYEMLPAVWDAHLMLAQKIADALNSGERLEGWGGDDDEDDADIDKDDDEDDEDSDKDEGEDQAEKHFFSRVDADDPGCLEWQRLLGTTDAESH